MTYVRLGGEGTAAALAVAPLHYAWIGAVTQRQATKQLEQQAKLAAEKQQFRAGEQLKDIQLLVKEKSIGGPSIVPLVAAAGVSIIGLGLLIYLVSK